MNPHQRVLGVGMDLVEVARFHDALQKQGDRFIQRLFTPQEQA